MTADNRASEVIEEHRNIWAEFHNPSGITLRESKNDWLELLADDPTMHLGMNWAEFAGTVSAESISEFKKWMESDDE